MADNRTKWAEAHQQILARLDIEAEYKQLGLRIASGARPRETGWLKCHAAGRQDDSPSAEINTGDGPARGRYRDFGSGNSSTISLFDFAAKFGSFGGDWKNARNHFAKQTGLKLPGGDELYPEDRLDLFDATAGMLLVYAANKPGVQALSLKAAGVKGARWPKKAPLPYQQIVIAFPMYGGSLLEADPIGWHIVEGKAGKVRRFKGKGAGHEMLKTMTLGTPGLMNVSALTKLPEAEVVWIVEGVSDMLALQSIIPANGNHIVLSAGSCSYHPKADWLPHFAGKDVRICFDIDPNQAGEIGASVWASALLPVASAVRIVRLPYEPGGDKNDLRDWLLEGHTYPDLLAFSGTFEPLVPESDEVQAEPHHQTLNHLEIMVCGQIQGTEQVEIFSRRLHKKTLIKDLNRFTSENAMLAFGGEVCDTYIYEGAEQIPGKYRIPEVRKAIAREAGKHPLSREETCGAGIWRVKDSFVLVGPRAADAWLPDGTLQRIETPAYLGQRLDFSGPQWYDRDQLVRYLQLSASQDWCEEQMGAACNLFARWDNWHERVSSQVLAGLIPATWLQTCWRMRPQIAVIGPSNSGKTVLVRDTLRPMFGPLSLACENPTEAGVRQAIRNSGQVLFIDEFDECDHAHAILRLLRGSTRGSKVIRGTMSQSGMNFSLKHITWISGVNINLTAAPDANRFILFKLLETQKGRAVTLETPTEHEARDLGLRMLALALRHGHAALAMAEQLARRPFGVSNRIVGLYAVPVAMLAVANGASIDQAETTLRGTLSQMRAGDGLDSDEAQLLNLILDGVVMMPRGVRSTVSALLDGYADDPTSIEMQDRKRTLENAGVKVLMNPYRLFLHKDRIVRELLKGTRFQNADIAQILARVPGAKTGVPSRLAGRSLRGIEIEYAQLADLCGIDPEEGTAF
jgi:hypothetical protein